MAQESPTQNPQSIMFLFVLKYCCPNERIVSGIEADEVFPYSMRVEGILADFNPNLEATVSFTTLFA